MQDKGRATKHSDLPQALEKARFDRWFFGPKKTLELGIGTYFDLRKKEVSQMCHLLWGIVFTIASFADLAFFFAMGGSGSMDHWEMVMAIAVGLRVSGFLGTIVGAVGLMEGYADREAWMRLAKSWHERNLINQAALAESSKENAPLSEALAELWEIGESMREGNRLCFSPWGFRYRSRKSY